MSTEPKYLHPSVTSKIIDNATTVITATGLNNMFVALEAEKGAPNEAMYISSASQFLFTLGEPNFSKWGQAGMNAINWLRAGGGLWVIRVVPDDETFASLSLGIGYNDEETYTNDEEEYNSLELTADQIKLWNLTVANEDDSRKFVKGLATGRTVPVEKFYAGKKVDGKIVSVESKLGTMTKDAIRLYNINNGVAEDSPEALKPLAVKKEMVERFGLSYFGEFTAASALNHAQQNENVKYVTYDVGKYANIAVVDFGSTTPVTYTAESTNIPTAIAAVLNNTAGYENAQAALDAAQGACTGIYTYTDSVIVDREVESATKYFVTSISVDVDNVAEAALIRNTADGHAAAYDTIFAATYESEEALRTALSTIDWVKYTLSKGKLTELIVANTTAISQGSTVTYFSKVYDETVGSTSVINDGKHVAFPKLITAVFEITKTSDWAAAIANITAAYGLQSAPTLVTTTLEGFYGPCYEKTYDDCEYAFDHIAAADKDANLKLVKVYSEAEWLPCYDVYFEDGTPVKITSMTENYIRWYNTTVSAYNQVVKGSEATTGIYERVKTFYVNYATTGERVFSFYTTEDAMEVFNTTKPETRAEVTKAAEMTDDSALESMVKSSETIFNEILQVAFEEASNSEDTKNKLKALTYLAPLFTYTVSDFEDEEAAIPGYKQVTAALAYNSAFVKNQARNVNVSYKDCLNADGTGFAATSSNADLKAIGLYNADGTLNSEFNKTYVFALPEIVAKVLAKNADAEHSPLALVNGYTTGYGVDIWNVSPIVSFTTSGGKNNVTFKVSFYSTANVANLIILEDKTGNVGIKSSSISEYLSKQNFTVTYEESGFVPNSDYIENIYKAIGFVSTVFTDRDSDNVNHDEKVPTDFKRGYVVGEDLSIIKNVDPADMSLSNTRFVEFARFVPKGSGPWYNRLAVSLAYDNSYVNTYPDWSMFNLSVIEKTPTAEIVRESFDVALDPDAISATKESLFIEDVVNRYSSYLTCYANYDNLQNFIETKLKITDSEGHAITDVDGNEIVPITDKVVKYIFNQISLDELNASIFGEDYQTSEFKDYIYTDVMSAIGYDKELCHLDTTLTSQAGSVIYNDPFVSEFYYQTVDTNAALYLGGGTRGNGWGHEVIDPATDEVVTTSTLSEALKRAYNGTTDPIVTNTQTCVFDIMLDANYDEVVKEAMSDLAALTRTDCITILDMNHDCANASQAVAKRKDIMQFNTYHTSIFSQTLGINDEWTGKPVRVTPTFFLASKIPQNDAAYTEVFNFVGPRRGIISGFRDISWLPTEPEKTELYKNQINYIEQDTQATMFATENTSQKITSPLSMIHAVRSLLKLKREMEQASRNYRMEFSTDDNRGLLQQDLNNIANNKVLAGGYEYISPVVSASAYDRQQKICRVKVDLAFTDIMERFVFEFVVNRAG